jgi:HSP20 family molecular chaperone IbpA
MPKPRGKIDRLPDETQDEIAALYLANKYDECIDSIESLAGYRPSAPRLSEWFQRYQVRQEMAAVQSSTEAFEELMKEEGSFSPEEIADQVDAHFHRGLLHNMKKASLPGQSLEAFDLMGKLMIKARADRREARETKLRLEKMEREAAAARQLIENAKTAAGKTGVLTVEALEAMQKKLKML